MGDTEAGRAATRPGAIAFGDGAASVSAHPGNAPSRTDHTPTPWRFVRHAPDGPGHWLGNIIGSYGLNRHGIEEVRTISCQTKYEGYVGEAEANAAFIVRAVNSHYDLVKACKLFLAASADAWPEAALREAEGAVRAALTKAEANHA